MHNASVRRLAQRDRLYLVRLVRGKGHDCSQARQGCWCNGSSGSTRRATYPLSTRYNAYFDPATPSSFGHSEDEK